MLIEVVLWVVEDDTPMLTDALEDEEEAEEEEEEEEDEEEDEGTSQAPGWSGLVDEVDMMVLVVVEL